MFVKRDLFCAIQDYGLNGSETFEEFVEDEWLETQDDGTAGLQRLLCEIERAAHSVREAGNPERNELVNHPWFTSNQTAIAGRYPDSELAEEILTCPEREEALSRIRDTDTLFACLLFAFDKRLDIRDSFRILDDMRADVEKKISQVHGAAPGM